MSSFDRHLRRMKYGKQIISSLEFSNVREVLKAKQKDLKSEGRGNISKKIRRNNGNKLIMGKRTVGCKQSRECDQFPVAF